MITITQAAETIINRSRYLTEALSKDLINISSLARYIQPEIQSMLQKPTSHAAIIMSLTRLSKKFTSHPQQSKIFTKKPDITVRSPMSSGRVTNDRIIPVYTALQTQLRACIVIASERSTQIIGPTETITQLKELFPEITRTQEVLATVTITLPKNAIDSAGGFYFFLKSLTWENIPIYEVISNREAFIIVVYERDVDRTYRVIRSLFE
jgi:hypothetical protein